MSEGDGSVGNDGVFHDVVDATDGEGGGDEVVRRSFTTQLCLQDYDTKQFKTSYHHKHSDDIGLSCCLAVNSLSDKDRASTLDSLRNPYNLRNTLHNSSQGSTKLHQTCCSSL